MVGATGVAGARTAEHLALAAPPGSRLAIAARSGSRLDALRDRLHATRGAGVEIAIVALDVADERAVTALAASTRLLASAVGPYLELGEPLVAACARAGTDYVDLAGESEFIDRMYLRHHEQARLTGARLVHGCGFESAAQDLGALFTVGRLPEGVPLRVEALVRLDLRGFRELAGRFSTGSLRSALVIMARRRQARRARSERRPRESKTGGRGPRALRSLPRYERELSTWALPGSGLDTRTVLRSAASIDRYGPEFVYRQQIAVERAAVAAALVLGGGLAVLLAQSPAVRRRISKRIDMRPEPTEAQLRQRRFSILMRGQGGGRRVLVELSGGDPGYLESAKILGEACLCLAHDELPAAAGQLTPAMAMGEALIGRLQARGLRFSVLREEVLPITDRAGLLRPPRARRPA